MNAALARRNQTDAAPKGGARRHKDTSSRDPGCKLRLVSYVKLTVSYSKIQLGLGKLVTFSARILSLRRVVQPPA